MISRFDTVVRKREAGFTLFEVVVVLTIFGLMTALLLSNGRQTSPAVHARAAARTISGALRQARSEALATNRSVAFTLDLAHRSYRWGSKPTENLPGDIELSLLTSRDQLAGTEAGRIRFDPDGGSSGGRVSIMGGGQAWWVGVDWLTGQVSIKSERR